MNEMSTREIDDSIIRAIAENELRFAVLIRKIAIDAIPNRALSECEKNAFVCGIRTRLADLVAQALPMSQTTKENR